MDLTTLLKRIDESTARAFVSAVRNVVDAMLIEAHQIGQTQTPGIRDYAHADLSRSAPAGGWLSHDELRRATQRMTEALAAEKWSDGVLFALQLLTRVGALG